MKLFLVFVIFTMVLCLGLQIQHIPSKRTEMQVKNTGKDHKRKEETKGFIQNYEKVRESDKHGAQRVKHSSSLTQSPKPNTGKDNTIIKAAATPRLHDSGEPEPKEGHKLSGTSEFKINTGFNVGLRWRPIRTKQKLKKILFYLPKQFLRKTQSYLEKLAEKKGGNCDYTEGSDDTVNEDYEWNDETQYDYDSGSQEETPEKQIEYENYRIGSVANLMKPHEAKRVKMSKERRRAKIKKAMKKKAMKKKNNFYPQSLEFSAQFGSLIDPVRTDDADTANSIANKPVSDELDVEKISAKDEKDLAKNSEDSRSSKSDEEQLLQIVELDGIDLEIVETGDVNQEDIDQEETQQEETEQEETEQEETEQEENEQEEVDQEEVNLEDVNLEDVEPEDVEPEEVEPEEIESEEVEWEEVEPEEVEPEEVEPIEVEPEEVEPEEIELKEVEPIEVEPEEVEPEEVDLKEGQDTEEYSSEKENLDVDADNFVKEPSFALPTNQETSNQLLTLDMEPEYVLIATSILVNEICCHMPNHFRSDEQEIGKSQEILLEVFQESEKKAVKSTFRSSSTGTPGGSNPGFYPGTAFYSLSSQACFSLRLVILCLTMSLQFFV